MKTCLPIAIASAALIALTVSCTESQQAGAPNTAAKPTTIPSVTPAPYLEPSPASDGNDGSEEEVDCDPNKDFAKLDFPTKVTDCLQREKMYDFEDETCGRMGKAITFDCTYAGIATELDTLELAASPLDSEKAKGGKLIGCGASNNGFIIVAQFFYKSSQASKSDCSFSKQGKVVSVCFRKFATENPPPPPTTGAAKKAYVSECLQQE